MSNMKKKLNKRDVVWFIEAKTGCWMKKWARNSDSELHEMCIDFHYTKSKTILGVTSSMGIQQ